MDQILDFLSDMDGFPKDFLSNTFTWLFVLCMVHCLTALIIKPNWPRFAKKDKYIRWSFYNRTVATFHSIVLTYLSFSYWWNHNLSFNINGYIADDYCIRCVDYMVAYLIYDGLHELTFPFKADKETLLHHVLGLITSISARFMNSNLCIFYYMIIYIAEGSTPFLHWCWGMYAMGFKETFLFNIVCMLVLISYFIVRICLGPYALYHLYSNRHLWTASASDNILYMPNFIILLIFNTLNFVWYKALLNKFFAPSTWKRGSEKEMEGAGAGAIRTAANDNDNDDNNSNRNDDTNAASPVKRRSTRKTTKK